MPTEKLLEIIRNPNLATDLDKDDLQQISQKVTEDYEEDVSSRSEWQTVADRILKLAKLTIEKKDLPWEGAANVKYPIIPTAILQFASRTYPQIVRDGKVVGCAVIGRDPTGEKGERARRVSEHMSYQVIIESPTWEEHMDRLLHVYPAIGVAFKKTYYDPIKQRNESVLCLHDEIVVNDNIQSLEDADRITHIVKQSSRTIIEYMRAGLYTDMDIDELNKYLGEKEDYHELLEQHRYLDLDKDKYPEPYIVTVHKASGKVLRVVARFDPTSITYNSKDEVIRITPVQYFTDFHCIPRMDGKYHSLGLGTLLLHSNEVINSVINNLMDAGTLANLQGGIIGDQVEIKGGTLAIAPGEWKKARYLGAGELKDQIVPVNYKEPSKVLFELLSLMIEATKDLSSVTDVLTGKQPAQNVPATTIQILAEEGKKVFTSMQRRLYRSLKSEFEKLYRLNRIYLPEQVYYRVLDDEKAILRTDYEDDTLDIKPVSDPNLSSETQRLAKAQTVLQMATSMPGMNLPEAQLRALREMDVTEPEKLLSPPQQQPNPEELKLQADMMKHKAEMELKARELQLKEREFMAKAPKLDADADKSKAMAIKHISAAATDEHNRAVDSAKVEIENEKVGIEKEKLNLEDHKLALDGHKEILRSMDNASKREIEREDVKLRNRAMENPPSNKGPTKKD